MALPLALLLAFFFWPGGILDCIKLNRDIAVREKAIKKIEAENNALKGRIDCLERDDACLEDAARKAGLVRDGERLVYVAGK